MEIIDLGIDNLEPISINMTDEPQRPKSPSVSFGPGIELLMNTDKRKNSASTKFNIDDLNTLEDELNDLSKSVNTGGQVAKVTLPPPFRTSPMIFLHRQPRK